MGKEVQLYGDEWKLSFGGQHVVYTEVKIWCMHEIHSYKPMLPQKIK